MWILFAFISSCFVGMKDVARKRALINNPVFEVLLLNLFFYSLLMSPIIVASAVGTGWFTGTWLDIPQDNFRIHVLVLIRSIIVLLSRLLVYFAIEHLPITLFSPIHATYPIFTLLGAMVLFGERLNALQWIGISVSIFSLFLLKKSGAKEGIIFHKNKWIWLLVASMMFKVISALYDKFLLQHVDHLFVQSWYNVYQLILLVFVLAIFNRFRSKSQKLHWNWAILGVSIFMIIADFFYFWALREPNVMISMVSIMRRSSVIFTFTFGAILFREKNIRSKSVDMIFILIGMIILTLGSYLHQ